MVEHLTFNQGVVGSSPTRLTSTYTTNDRRCSVAGAPEHLVAEAALRSRQAANDRRDLSYTILDGVLQDAVRAEDN